VAERMSSATWRSSDMRLLITRPEPEASRFAETVRPLGVEPCVYPLLDYTPLAFDGRAIEDASALIVTSSAALRALSATVWIAAARQRPLYAVGNETASRAKMLGIHVAAFAETANELADKLKERQAPGPLAYLSGLHRSFDLETSLSEAGIAVYTLEVYDMIEKKFFPDWLIGELKDGKMDGVLLMSARTAGIFVSLCQEHDIEDAVQPLSYFCLSEAVAAKLAPLSPKTALIAARPAKHAIVELISSRA